MSIAAKIRRAPLRLTTGAFILNSGLNKIKGDEQTAQALHGMAVGAYPVLDRVKPKPFLTLLAISEITVGGLLLLPLAPAGLAGLALLGFSGAMVGLYVRTDGLHDKYLRPSQEGTAIAKDTWMAAIGVALIVDAALSESPITRTEGP